MVSDWLRPLSAVVLNDPLGQLSRGAEQQVKLVTLPRNQLKPGRSGAFTPALPDFFHVRAPAAPHRRSTPPARRHRTPMQLCPCRSAMVFGTPSASRYSRAATRMTLNG